MFTRSGLVLSQTEGVLRGRRLAAVDIENIAGGAIRAPEQARKCRKLMEEVVVIDQTQVVVAVSRAGLVPAYMGWGQVPAPRYVTGHGINGADLVLLDVLDNEDIATRFDEVILASGDGIFADSVARLGARGVRVTVVAHRDGVAKRLIMAASDVVLLGSSGQVGGAA